MKITFIGTGSGITRPNRFYTSLLVGNGFYNLLIDTGDGISKALINTDVNLNDIDLIFITHTHADHFSGIVSLLTQMKFNGRVKPLRVYVHSAFENFTMDFFHYSFLFPETFDFKFKIIGYDFGKRIELAEGFKILPLQNSHIRNKHNIRNLSDLQFVSSSVLIESKDTSLHYTSDVGSIFDLSLFQKFNPKYLIVESTHIPFNEIVKFIFNSNYEKTYLVHINDNDKIIEQYQKLSEQKRSKMEVAFDGMKVNLS